MPHYASNQEIFDYLVVASRGPAKHSSDEPMESTKNTHQLRLQLVNFFLHADADPSSGALQVAFEKEPEELVQLLLLEGDPESSGLDEDEGTPLHLASSLGLEKMAQLFLNTGVDIEAESSEGKTALHCACTEGHIEVVELLLAHGASTSARGIMGYTPLHCAAHCGHDGIVRILIAAGADVGTRNNDLATPLHSAAAEGHVAVLELLLGEPQGATHPSKTETGQQPCIAPSP
jgi:ankyrin repeat protein